MFDVRDRIYGLHFNLRLSRYCGDFREPFLALVRLEEFHSSGGGGGGKDFVFPVQHDTDRHYTYYVHAQLSRPLDNNRQMVIVRIVDSKDTTVALTFLTYHWLYRQRVRFIEKKSLDDMRCIVRRKHLKCHLALVRMGCRVACTSVSSQFWPSEMKQLDTECSIFQFWVQQNTRPGSRMPILLAGNFPTPIFVYSALDNATDVESFSMDGLIKYSGQSARSFLHDLKVCGRIVDRMLTSPHAKLGGWIHLMCGSRSTRENSVSHYGFTFPQFNFLGCGESDLVGIHMVFLHLLYASQHIAKLGLYGDISTFLNTDSVGMQFLKLMHTSWPCVLIGRTPSKEYKPFCGMIEMHTLNNLIFNNASEICDGDIVVLDSGMDDGCIEVCLISWRDYKNAFISTCLVQDKREFNHYQYETIRGLGVKMVRAGDGLFRNDSPHMFSVSHIRPHSVISKSLDTAIQLNSSKMIRPLLRCDMSLDEMHEGAISSIRAHRVNALSQKIPWHSGWITSAKNMWECNHLVTSFDTWQCVFVNYPQEEAFGLK